jgi:pimeloyl-ACP methyl ester carboxylesterase
LASADIDFEHLRLGCRGLHFSAMAAGRGPLVLLLHGFPDCYRSFDTQLAALAAAGYRAVSVAMRGYEAGSQPDDGDYSQAALVEDVVAFVDALGAGRAHLVGHDWGAAVAYPAASFAPDRFMFLTTMAVPHSGRFVRDLRHYPKQLRLSWYMGFFQLPVLPERVLARNDFAFLHRLWRRWSPGWAYTDEDFEPVAQTFRARGVTEAALAYYRAASPMRSLSSRADRIPLRPVPVPTLAMTGERDGCIAAEVFEAMCRPEDFHAGLRVERLRDAGHFLHRERPAEVNRLLLSWLSSH